MDECWQKSILARTPSSRRAWKALRSFFCIARISVGVRMILLLRGKWVVGIGEILFKCRLQGLNLEFRCPNLGFQSGPEKSAR